MTDVNPAKLLNSLISISSPSGNEADIASHAYNFAKQAGLSVGLAGPNVVIRIGRSGGRKLLINSHLDTVAPSADWKTDPFTPIEDDGKIIGLGANDAKGCVASILCAAVRCRDIKCEGEVIVALTVEEETGRGGRGLETLIGEIDKIDAAVIGEPTGLSICRAQKGLLILEVETKGDARHSAHAHRIKGKNAITLAARAILEVDGLSIGPDSSLLGFVTCNVTKIEGGKSRNVIPDRCTFCLDIRTVPGISTLDIVHMIESKTYANVHVLSDRLKPFETDLNSPIVQAALRARPEAQVIGSATMSDAAWTRHVPTIKVGPGDTSRSHMPGEYITLQELHDGVSFYKRLIHEYFA